MSDIFISYRRDDGWMMANLLYEKLCNNGYDVFLDTRNDQMLQQEYEPVIFENLGNSKDHIILISSSSFNCEPNSLYLREIERTEKKYTGTTKTINRIPIMLPADGGVINNFSLTKSPVFCLAKLAELTYETISNDAAAFPSEFNRIKKRLQSKPIFKKAVVSSRKILERESLDVRWSDAQEIDICSYFANMLIFSDCINQALAKGVHIKYLVVDPESYAAEEVMKYRLKNVTENTYRSSFDEAVNLYQAMKNSDFEYFDKSLHNGELEVRKTTLHLDQAIMIVKKKIISDSTVKVDLYTFDTDDTNRRSIMIPFGDKENFDFFCRQFDYIWKARETTGLCD